MSELRWNPILKEWVITATHRQDRTFKPPRDFCPLCPTRKDGFPTEVPTEDYDIIVFENKFPSLTHNPGEPEVTGSDLYKVKKSHGICEVVLFSSEHDSIMSEKPVSRFQKLIKVWRDRYQELGKKDYINYVFIFENKGEEVGVTLHHPHGQIYGYPFIPPKIKKELDSSRDHFNTKGNCLFCDVLKEEQRDGRRIIADNKGFTAFVPFFAAYTYEVHIYAKRHISSFNDFTEQDEKDLASILKLILMKYDNLYGFIFPYIMSIHQQPTDGTGADYSHFHIEFYPLYRTKDKLKYLAGSESGAGSFINDALAEEKAEKMRMTEPRGEDIFGE